MTYGDSFEDVIDRDGYISLPPEALLWPLNIRLGYFVFRQGATCMIEPCMLNMFAMRFGYDQLYVGNPSPVLGFIRSWLEVARAWYYNNFGDIYATFALPQKTPNSWLLQMVCGREPSTRFQIWNIMHSDAPRLIHLEDG